MKGYFSQLARRTGVRIGAGNATAASAPAGPTRPLHAAPLEVEEIREAAPEPVQGFGLRERQAPSQESEPRMPSAGSLPGIRRIEQPVHASPDPGLPERPRIEDLPATERSHEGRRTHEMPAGIERFETRIVQPDPEPQGAVPSGSGAGPVFEPARDVRSGEMPGVEIPRFEMTSAEQPVEASPEEYVIRMIEGDRARSTGPGSTTVPPSTERELLREVIEWISSPAVPLPEEPERGERRSIREIERMVEAVPAGHYAEAQEVRGIDRAVMRPGDVDPMRGERPREPEVQDFTLSIGSIRVVIEEPREQVAPQQAPPARAEAPAPRAQSGDASRLSRHYITFG